MAIAALSDVRPNLLYAPAKVCPTTPDSLEVPPLVQFFSSVATKVSAGLGVLVADHWVLTCEHIIAGGATRYCDPLNDTRAERLEVVGAYLEGCSIFVRADRLSGIIGYRAKIDSHEERLALVRLRNDDIHRNSASPFFIHRPSKVSLWASEGLAPPSPNCRLAKVEFASFSPLHGTRCWLTEEFSNATDAVVEGDSGGGFFAENPFGFQLVAIQNASSQVRGRNTAVALGIPVQPAASWIQQVITDG